MNPHWRPLGGLPPFSVDTIQQIPACTSVFVGASGMWRISPSDMLDIDSVSGAALVRNTGTATIYHDIPGTGKTYGEVFVPA